MNTEKAVDLLDNLIGMVDDNQGNDYDAALHMAMNVLKAQADGDTISRKAAIDAFKPYADYESNRTNADWVRRIELVLHDLPSAQPEEIDSESEKACKELNKMCAELKAHNEYLRRQNDSMKGEIKALKFAVRCCGVSGNEVQYESD